MLCVEQDTWDLYISREEKYIDFHNTFGFYILISLRKGETREVKKACMRRHIDRCLMVIMEVFLLDVVSELKTARTFDPAPRWQFVSLSSPRPSRSWHCRFASSTFALFSRHIQPWKCRIITSSKPLLLHKHVTHSLTNLIILILLWNCHLLRQKQLLYKLLLLPKMNLANQCRK